MYEGHRYPVEVIPGCSSYYRIRFFMGEYPSARDFRVADEALREWLKNCAEGEYGEKFKIISQEICSKAMVPQIEIRFDIINSPKWIVDRFFTVFDKYFPHGVVKAVISFYNIL